MSERRLHRFSVSEYYKLLQAGILHEDGPVELLEGQLVDKMPQNPPHASCIELIRALLHLPAG